MKNKDFVDYCKNIVVDYFNSKVETTDRFKITKDDVYIVWLCKTLQNNKALVSTNVPDGHYYEITHNGDKNETYVDVYKKWTNYVAEPYQNFKNLADLIKTKREQMDISKKQFSKKLGISRNTLQKIEDGKFVGGNILNKISIAIDIPKETLIKLNGGF